MTLVDKGALLLTALTAAAACFSPRQWILPLLLLIIVLSVNEYLDKPRLAADFLLALCGVAVWYPPLLPFLPVACYDDLRADRSALLRLVWVFPLLLHFGMLNMVCVLGILAVAAMTVLLRARTIRLQKLQHLSDRRRDDLTELSRSLEFRLQHALSEQEYEIREAALSERNRIAREIHDSVGHLLSSAILQLGAIRTVAQTPAISEGLADLDGTLNKSMTAIRKSVHDLRDDGLSLYDSLQEIARGFTFCEVALEYELSGNPEARYIHAILAIVREALANVMRHSNATKVTVVVCEHPSLYQLIVTDNGTLRPPPDITGMGLQNIRQRAESFGGAADFRYENGFRVFASFRRR